MINTPTQKKIFIETYGCQMNAYDTELVRSILLKENYAFVPKEEEADIILLNTCAIREHAHRKVYGRVHNIHHKRKKLNKLHEPNKPIKPVMIGILGCMATNLRTQLFEDRGLKIDFIAGPDSYKKLPSLIEQASSHGKQAFDLTLSEFETYSDIYPVRTKGADAGIAVMRGCNNFCSFCVVPYTRGRERSRTLDNVVEEVRKLADEGFKQVTLLGQNVNSYHDGQNDFADLLEAIAKVNGIYRIRFISPHPKDFPEKLLHVIVGNPKVCKHVHMPLQSGNNRILELMNRGYTKEEFLKLAQKTRQIIPHATLTTDIITGFCSETEEEFQDTLSVMQEVEFDFTFIFKYSERKNTMAYKKYPDDIPDDVKTDRLMRLNEMQIGISLKRNQQLIGETHDVLIDNERTAKSTDECSGRNDGNKIVNLPNNGYKVGDIVKAKIIAASVNSLKGEAVNVESYSSNR